MPLPSGNVTAIGVATPIPPIAPRAGHGPPPAGDGTDPDATDLGLAGAFIDPDVTRVPAAPLDDDVTGVPAAAVDPDVTRVPATQDVDVTRVPRTQDFDVTGVPVTKDADVTRVPTARSSDDDETGLGGPPAAPRRGSRGGTTRGGRSRGGQTLGGFGEVATDLVGKDLGDRYHIIKLLGAGGMGAVYQAWDAELGVAVALKTVRPEVAADPSTARMLEQRFKQELLLARKVTHKNIVRVHDIGELDGLKYITMPFVEGEDLATILKREGKLPVPRVMTLARSVASGLAAAHQAGVVHRDLKPANIMVDADGEGLVMDFGVARSVTGPPAGGAAGTFPAGAMRAVAAAHTMVGSVVGTVEYMAPEQARAEAVDQRADIYAFGLILYDLLLGKVRAERTGSVMADLQQRMKEPPPPPRSLDPTIPAALDKLIVRCVQTDPAKRFATTQDLLADLAKLDAKGAPLPLVRRLTWKTTTAAAVLVAGLVGVTYWAAQGPPPAVEHEPVSILISDLTNTTGDVTLNGTLEPILKLALEGAGFISAYDRAGIRRQLGVTPPDVLDEAAGRSIAVNQGVGVVLAGSVALDGNGYALTLKATESVTGTVIVDASGRAAGKDQVLSVATTLGNRVLTALGDDTSDSAQRFATDTLSATSLDVVREYAMAMQALSNSKFDQARHSFGQAVKIDPNFGLAYAGMAIASANMGQPQEAATYVQEAIRHVDKMTERERFRTRGMFYYITNDYEACVKEYGDLLIRYEADAAARNNLALCSTKLRDMSRAREEMQRVVQILPKRSLYRVNAALYSAYASDYTIAEEQARVAQELQDPWAMQALAIAQQGQGRPADAIKSYEALANVPGAGRTYTVSGLADVALYEGRFADAASLFADGAKADLAEKDGDRAAAKFAALAYTELARGRRVQARAAAEQAVANSGGVQIQFLAARIYAQTGAATQARAIATKLGAELQAEPQAYGKIIEGVIALEQKNARQAVALLSEATELLDTWIGRFDLGRAYLAAGAYPQADSEFDRCLKRSGEALSLFLDEEPTSGFLPPVYYYQGRVREGMKSAGFAEPFRTYLAIREKAGEDPLVADIRKRIGS
jgi:serine/threonine protein kinase/tetratricopeptide (TPR) repeat protein